MLSWQGIRLGWPKCRRHRLRVCRWTQNGLVVREDELRRYSMAVRLNATEVAWMHTAVEVGTVNTGTTDQYFIFMNAGTVAGRATRTAAIRPEFTRNLPTEVAVVQGGDLFLSVDAIGAPAPQYQWYLSTVQGDFPFLEPILSTDTRFDIDFINNTSLSSTPTLVLTLPPGRYTAQVSGADGGTGQAIVEIYELP